MQTATITSYTDTATYDPSVDTTPAGVDPKVWRAFEECRLSIRKARKLGIV